MKFLYFAYGSNMLPARLLGRCPSAKALGLGVARAWNLEFSKASQDGSGKATLVAAPNSAIPGVIFEIDLSEREQLDRHEGVGFGYKRDDDFVVEGSTVTTSSYLGTSLDQALRPFDWYLATVIAGAEHHQLDADHVAALRSTLFVDDSNWDRKARVAAIEAMRKHGIKDYRKLLEDRG
ncbi:gamma-glutamylcyclotransferase family protein [Novosphingobium nitrogenifigens]|uniref:gamma-glutamylcyclotransferase family protein n=1 Tax=Novosphingobium nitrogenifigens TaxID=378548 RepID=UPI00035C1297|nr:gamma-glutamylcyclotransferase family protein [Novosphingobium nitrogenifigens]